MNKTIVSGNVGSEDAQLGYTTTGTPVLNFNFATSGTYKTKEGEKKTDTTWFKAAYYGERAVKLAQYVISGKKLLLTGKVKAKAWKGENGEPRADLVLIVDELEFGGSSNNGASAEAAETEVGVIDDTELFPTASNGG